ncbi:MAG: helix-turn-helix domain-containing protein [Bacteroidales bacterium]|nr:helix-turn-helix domain-containing protein [Bacteroidales bacterium]
MKNIFAYRLKNARKIKGFSMQLLAEKLGVSKQMISKYENAESIPDSNKIIALSNILDVKPDYFFQASTVSLESIRFRKKSKYSKTKIESLKAKILNKVESYLSIEDILSVQSEFINPLKNIKITSADDVENAAIKLRMVWKIGNDPIHNIISLLETHGIKVVEIKEPDHKLFDGLSTYLNNKYPVIVINKSFGIERKRFTLLHELGHLLLNINKEFSEKEEEKFCNRFAGAMLLPQEILIEEIGIKRQKISLTELINFQKQFGISISAQIYRLADLEIISENRKKSFYIKRNLNAELKESVDKERFAGKEFSERFMRLVYKALSQEIISISKASAFLNTDINSIRNKLALI